MGGQPAASDDLLLGGGLEIEGLEDGLLVRGKTGVFGLGFTRAVGWAGLGGPGLGKLLGDINQGLHQLGTLPDQAMGPPA